MGCGGTKELHLDGASGTDKSASMVVNKTAQRNITTGGFFIHKGRIKSIGEEGRINLYFTMKFSPPSKYLISIRSKTGMEAFRVYLTGDTVLINDRLNKSVLYGNTNDFERIVGLPIALLKVSLGDLFLIDPKLQPDEICIDNEVRLNEYFLGLMVKSTIDCRIDKVKSVLLTTGVPDEFVTIEYKKARDDNYGLPKKVEINDFRRKIKITLSLDKYSSPWVGEIEFLPGLGYTVKPLL
jgi:hypothetical protein